VSARLLARADAIAVTRIVSRGCPDPAALLAAELGAAPRETVYTPHGGQMPQALCHDAALRIQDGRADVVIVGGADGACSTMNEMALCCSLPAEIPWRMRGTRKRIGAA
jgi:acetyl-CoA C-acetyltransferase